MVVVVRSMDINCCHLFSSRLSAYYTVMIGVLVLAIDSVVVGFVGIVLRC